MLIVKVESAHVTKDTKLVYVGPIVYLQLKQNVLAKVVPRLVLNVTTAWYI